MPRSPEYNPMSHVEAEVEADKMTELLKERYPEQKNFTAEQYHEAKKYVESQEELSAPEQKEKGEIQKELADNIIAELGKAMPKFEFSYANEEGIGVDEGKMSGHIYGFIIYAKIKEGKPQRFNDNYACEIIAKMMLEDNDEITVLKTHPYGQIIVYCNANSLWAEGGKNSPFIRQEDIKRNQKELGIEAAYSHLLYSSDSDLDGDGDYFNYYGKHRVNIFSDGLAPKVGRDENGKYFALVGWQDNKIDAHIVSKDELANKELK